MKENLTEIVAVLDRSGSMMRYIDDNIGGFNQLIEEQKVQDGDANITLTIFDDSYDMIHAGVNINDVPVLTKETYFARGFTALHDAVCFTIDSVGQRLASIPEEDRPEKVIFVIMTDGCENVSVKFNGQDVKSRIEKQTKDYNWEFSFVGANQDAITTAQGMGISAGAALNMSQDKTDHTYAVMSKAVSRVRNSNEGFRYMKSERKEVI